MTEPVSQPAPPAPANMHPIRLVVADDLKRSRLSVFFRLLLAYPQFWWVAIWGFAASFALVAQWFYLLFTGHPAHGLHRFLSRYQRQYAHALAYFHLLANPYPHFSGLAGDYPVDLEIDGPAPQARWKTLLRIILVIPAYVLAYIFQYLGLIVSVLMWIVAVIMGRVPRGLRDFSAYLLRYQLQTFAYLFLLTDRYPALSTPDPKGPVEVVPPPRPTLTGEYV
jgi:hypothetical protein